MLAKHRIGRNSISSGSCWRHFHTTSAAELQDIDFMTISITLSTAHRCILNMAILQFKTRPGAANGNYICIPSECFNPLCSHSFLYSFKLRHLTGCLKQREQTVAEFHYCCKKLASILYEICELSFRLLSIS